MLNWILLSVSVLLIITGYLLRRIIDSKLSHNIDASSQGNDSAKRIKRYKLVTVALMVVGGFLFTTRLLDIVFGPRPSAELDFSLWPERVEVFNFSLSYTIIYTWIAMAVLIIAAIIIRLTVFKNPKEVPSGAQNVVEFIVESIGKYTNAQAHGTGEFLCSYILTIGSLLVMSAFLELFRLRPPTADITMTFSLAFMTFLLINIYGIKKKGIFGRLKSLASPTPIVFPFRIVSDLAIPVSMACRLFGNMLGGMIVIDLLYMALGGNAVGIPSVFGLYFNAFHPLIQTYIFVTLTLTFINEAIE